jgi:hypothetical protein
MVRKKNPRRQEKPMFLPALADHPPKALKLSFVEPPPVRQHAPGNEEISIR